MIVDRRSTGWITACLLIFVGSLLFYLPYASRPNGASGGSLQGLIFGVLGSAMIVLAILLSARKKLRSWRMGKTYLWMQAHVWFGLLSYPVILFHAGFHWGGVLTQTLMWIFTAVILSGVIGLVLQQIIPRKMMRELPAETIYQQIDHVVDELRAEAEELIRMAPRCAPPNDDSVGGMHSGSHVDVAMAPPLDPHTKPLREFYGREVAPYLSAHAGARSRLADRWTASTLFQEITLQLGPELRETVTGLESLVDERRQLAHQRRLHRLLHGWLVVHVPLSYALLILGALHAVMALRFTRIGL